MAVLVALSLSVALQQETHSKSHRVQASMSINDRAGEQTLRVSCCQRCYLFSQRAQCCTAERFSLFWGCTQTCQWFSGVLDTELLWSCRDGEKCWAGIRHYWSEREMLRWIWEWCDLLVFWLQWRLLILFVCFSLRNRSSFCQSFEVDEMRKKGKYNYWVFFLLTVGISVAYSGKALASRSGFVFWLKGAGFLFCLFCLAGHNLGQETAAHRLFAKFHWTWHTYSHSWI